MDEKKLEGASFSKALNGLRRRQTDLRTMVSKDGASALPSFMRSDLQVQRLTETAQLPTQGTIGSAGWDLYADLPTAPIYIAPGEVAKIPTGIAVALPVKTFGGIYARSGLAVNKGLVPANQVGIIDSDYRGEVIVALRNMSTETQVVENGDRIAQLIIQPYHLAACTEMKELPHTRRGAGGFGSTGMK